MIELRGLSKAYETGAGPVHALNNIDLKIGSGEFLSVMGQSGSGKSTLMNILGCLDRPTEGKYLLGDLDVANLSDKSRSALRGRWFGFIFQNYNLLPRLSALEQVELPLLYNNVAGRRRLAAAALEQLGLSDRIHHRPNQLSGGQQQRFAIARSLVANPQVILADEPTGALDTDTGNEIMGILSDLVRERGITLVVVTHESHIANWSDRSILMKDGRIVEDSLIDASVNRLEA